MFQPGDVVRDLKYNGNKSLGVGVVLWYNPENYHYHIRFVDQDYHDGWKSSTIAEALALVGELKYFEGGPDSHARPAGDLILIERSPVAKYHRLARFELILED